MGIGFSLDLAAVLLFHRADTTVSPTNPGSSSALVMGGVFRFSRNPMYLGLVLQLIGWGLWLGSLSPFLVPPLFALAITTLQIIPEEQALTEKFGDDYLRYRTSTRRWLGRTQPEKT